VRREKEVAITKNQIAVLKAEFSGKSSKNLNLDSIVDKLDIVVICESSSTDTGPDDQKKISIFWLSYSPPDSLIKQQLSARKSIVQTNGDLETAKSSENMANIAVSTSDFTNLGQF
jgi:hypothetical protein